MSLYKGWLDQLESIEEKVKKCAKWEDIEFSVSELDTWFVDIFSDESASETDEELPSQPLKTLKSEKIDKEQLGTPNKSKYSLRSLSQKHSNQQDNFATPNWNAEMEQKLMTKNSHGRSEELEDDILVFKDEDEKITSNLSQPVFKTDPCQLRERINRFIHFCADDILLSSPESDPEVKSSSLSRNKQATESTPSNSKAETKGRARVRSNAKHKSLKTNYVTLDSSGGTEIEDTSDMEMQEPKEVCVTPSRHDRTAGTKSEEIKGNLNSDGEHVETSEEDEDCISENIDEYRVIQIISSDDEETTSKHKPLKDTTNKRALKQTDKNSASDEDGDFDNTSKAMTTSKAGLLKGQKLEEFRVRIEPYDPNVKRKRPRESDSDEYNSPQFNIPLRKVKKSTLHQRKNGSRQRSCITGENRHRSKENTHRNPDRREKGDTSDDEGQKRPLPLQGKRKVTTERRIFQSADADLPQNRIDISSRKTNSPSNIPFARPKMPLRNSQSRPIRSNNAKVTFDLEPFSPRGGELLHNQYSPNNTSNSQYFPMHEKVVSMTRISFEKKMFTTDLSPHHLSGQRSMVNIMRQDQYHFTSQDCLKPYKSRPMNMEVYNNRTLNTPRLRDHDVIYRRQDNRGNQHRSKVLSNALPNPFSSPVMQWTGDEIERLNWAVTQFRPTTPVYWQKVSRLVGSKSPSSCQGKFMDLKDSGRANRRRKHVPQTKMERKQSQLAHCRSKQSRVDDVQQEPQFRDIVTGRKGTLKRKRQLREFMDLCDEAYENDPSTATPCRELMSRGKFPLDPNDIEYDTIESEESEQGSFNRSYNGIKDDMRYSPGFLSSPNESEYMVSPSLSRPCNRDEIDRYIFKLRKERKQNSKITRPAKRQKLDRPGYKESTYDLLRKNLNEIEWASNKEYSDSEDEQDYYFDE